MTRKTFLKYGRTFLMTSRTFQKKNLSSMNFREINIPICFYLSDKILTFTTEKAKNIVEL